MVFLASGRVKAQAVDLAKQLESTESTSPEEKVRFTRSAIDEMKADVKSVSKLLDGAQKEGDAEAIECVRTKLASIKALLEVTERSDGAMTEALAAKDMARADHEFRKVAVALSKVRQFVAESETCVGQKAVASGATQVQVIVQNETEVDDTRSFLEVEGVDEDPPRTSPFQ